ncbi:MAG TPA: hypothetical protein VMS21_00590, partial [Methylomirabilota bacterium]|nr:hypothetical protein [Methylomirabilota bacterium]
ELFVSRDSPVVRAAIYEARANAARVKLPAKGRLRVTILVVGVLGFVGVVGWLIMERAIVRRNTK